MLYSGMSDIGRKRASNQDTYRIIDLSPSAGAAVGPDGMSCRASALLAVVCDGMGGMNGGNIASQVAVESFTESFVPAFLAAAKRASEPADEDDDILRPFAPSTASSLRNAADIANREVMKRAAADPALEGMGTTLLAACISEGTMYIANVGDCRLYTVTNKDLHRVTKDHSYVQYLIDAGELEPEDAETSPYRNIITRAVGREENLETDVFTVPLDNFSGYILMCSDGLYNYLSEEELVDIVNCAAHEAASDGDRATTNSAELTAKVVTLVSQANENGGGDNITAVLIKYGRGE